MEPAGKVLERGQPGTFQQALFVLAAQRVENAVEVARLFRTRQSSTRRLVIGNSGYSIAQCLMQPFTMAEAFDVADDHDPRSIACRERLPVDELVLQGSHALSWQSP